MALVPDDFDDELVEAVRRWLEFKIELEGPNGRYTPSGWKGWLSQHRKWGKRRLIEAIDYSISKQWKGVYEEKNDGTNGASSTPKEHSPPTLTSEQIAERLKW